MEKIIIGFSRSSKKNAIFSKLIMAVEGTPYSHVYIKFYSGKLDRWIIYQASHTMVNFMGEGVFNKEETIIEEFTFDISDDVKNSMMNFCLDHAGEPYGITSVLGIGYVKLMQLFKKKVDNPIKTGFNNWFCAKIIAALLESCTNVNIEEDIETITPKDLHPIVKNLPKVLL